MHKDYRDIGDPFDCLTEECGELIQALMKVKRFGLKARHPDTGETNLSRVLYEIADVKERMSEVLEIIVKGIQCEDT